MYKATLLLAASSILILGGMAAVIIPDTSNLKPGDTLGGIFPSSIHFVGNADGKSFFADNATSLNFTQARTYCEGMGMNLATIRSLNQSEALSNGFGDYFNGTFWTAGEDAQLLRQFSWNNTNSALNGAYVQIGEFLEVQSLTCLAYHSRNVTEGEISHLDSAACVKLLRTLCET